MVVQVKSGNGKRVQPNQEQDRNDPHRRLELELQSHPRSDRRYRIHPELFPTVANDPCRRQMVDLRTLGGRGSGTVSHDRRSGPGRCRSSRHLRCHIRFRPPKPSHKRGRPGRLHSIHIARPSLIRKDGLYRWRRSLPQMRSIRLRPAK